MGFENSINENSQLNLFMNSVIQSSNSFEFNAQRLLVDIDSYGLKIFRGRS